MVLYNMKKLNTYITERILINKNTKLYKLSDENQHRLIFFAYVFAKYELCTMVYDLELNVMRKWQDIFEWMLDIIEKPSKGEQNEFDTLSKEELLYIKFVISNLCKNRIEDDTIDEIKDLFIQGFMQYKKERD